MQDTFSSIYETSTWGTNDISEYNGSSGPGSSIEFNMDEYIPFLKKYIQENHIKSVVDLGCGDFRCGSLIYEDLDVKYHGYDAYAKVINYNKKTHVNDKFLFTHLDFFTKKEDILSGDLCILKDVIQHWPLKSIYEFLDYIVSSGKFKHILIINCCDQSTDDTDINVGDWRELNSEYLPLRKYNPVSLLKYKTKEICVIRL